MFRRVGGPVFIVGDGNHIMNWMNTARWVKRQAAGVAVVVAVAGLHGLASLPETSAGEIAQTAAGYRFTPMAIAMPPAPKQQSVRRVNQAYQHIRSWISAVGAGIAMTDLQGAGKAQDLCIVDPRSDQVVITPTPNSGPRYAPFALNPAPLPMNEHIAPMGCVPGDFDESGRIGFLVYYWGRTPILFLANPAATHLDATAFVPTELVAGPNATNGVYTGPQWNSNTATVADFDGDGHADIFIGNYFPDSPVLDDTRNGGVVMNESFSHAANGGGGHILRFTGATPTGAHPSASYQEVPDALPANARHGWTLAVSSNDLTGDGLPDLYLANDFGTSKLLHNRSTPGHFAFTEADGVQHPATPKSKVLGHASFKGMGVDFGDLNHDGLYDLFVSNITTSWGIEESNFQFMNTATDQADLRAQLDHGVAPFEDRSTSAGTAWSGWGWDVKMGDFNNSGNLAITQATGFVKGNVNRWPQLQELATSNDAMTSNPLWWPNLQPGDDIGGGQTLHFYAKTPDGRYNDIAPQLGLADPVPTRGITTGDSTGTGRLDLAVARQWDAPVFYRNDTPTPGNYLELNLTHGDTPAAPGLLPAAGSPAIGTQVRVTTPDGHIFIDRVDGGSGHSGKRSHQIHIGLGATTGPLTVHLQWRDHTGLLHQQNLTLTPGQHALTLGATAVKR